jgi:hypothetical protein
MEPQTYNIHSTADEWTKDIPSSNHDHSNRYDPNETPTVNSTNPNYHPSSTSNTNTWDKNNSTIETAADKAKGELKKGQQHAEDIITKSKRLIAQQCKLNEDKFQFQPNSHQSYRLI